MPFQKGTSGNPGGRPKTKAIPQDERSREARKSWARLIQIRDGLILEQKDLRDGSTIFVSPSVRDLLKSIEMILDRVEGKPAQAITGPDGDPLQITISQAVVNAEVESSSQENSIPICISGSDGPSA